MGLLSRLGIGSATVDTLLPEPRVTAGGDLPVRVELRGGTDRQAAEALVLGVFTRGETADGVETVPVTRSTLATDLVVEPGTDRWFETTVDLPPWTPVTREGTEVWVDTALSVEWAVDPEETAPLRVDPGPRLSDLLGTLDQLGFVPHRAVPVRAGGEATMAPPPGDDRPLVQRFDCYPHSGPYVGEVDRLTVVAVPSESDLTVHLHTDVHTDLLFETTDAYDRFATLELTDGPAEPLAHRLERAIGGGEAP